MTEMTDRLARLGDALEAAARADVAATTATAASMRPRRRRAWTGRRLLLAAAIALLVPAGAVAATQLIGGEDVAASMPAGTLALAGTEPTCTVVTEGVEFHCTLAKAPAPEVQDWKGTVEPTVDRTKHVNGGCRSLASDGREWECYVGQAAVEQKIVGASLLGEYAPAPGVG